MATTPDQSLPEQQESVAAACRKRTQPGSSDEPLTDAQGVALRAPPTQPDRGRGSGILHTIAMVIIFQGLFFFGASYLDSRIHILPTDPLIMLGTMYCVMGLQLFGVACFYANQHNGHHNAAQYRMDDHGNLSVCARSRTGNEAPPEADRKQGLGAAKTFPSPSTPAPADTRTCTESGSVVELDTDTSEEESKKVK